MSKWINHFTIEICIKALPTHHNSSYQEHWSVLFELPSQILLGWFKGDLVLLRMMMVLFPFDFSFVLGCFNWLTIFCLLGLSWRSVPRWLVERTCQEVYLIFGRRWHKDCTFHNVFPNYSSLSSFFICECVLLAL